MPLSHLQIEATPISPVYTSDPTTYRCGYSLR
jgi:hypothetical protein